MRIVALLSFLSLALGNPLFAQTGTVQVIGKVYDEDRKTTLPFAHVLSSKWATTTNLDGRFQAPLERNDTIRISFVGFKDYKFTVPVNYDDGEIFINVIMQRDTIYLEEAEIFFLPENEEKFKEAIIALELDEIEYDYALSNISLMRRQLKVVNYDKDIFDAAENARSYMRGPQPVYFNVVFDKLREVMRIGRRRKNLPELKEINPSAFSGDNNKAGITDEAQKAFSDSIRMQSDSTFIKILESIKKTKKQGQN